MVSATFDTKAIMKALQELPRNIEKNIMVGATRAAANVVLKEAKERVAVDTGNLRKSLGLIKRRGKKNRIIFSITPRSGGKKDAFYGKFIELGTSKMTPKPYLRPALEASIDTTLQASKDYIATRLPQEVEKARR